MKKILLATFLLFISVSVFAQQRTIKNPTIIQGVLVKTTVALKDFKPEKNWKNEVVRDNEGLIGEREEFEDRLHKSIDANALPKGEDPALQKLFTNPNNNSPKALTQNYNGIGNQPLSPADPSLCAGPNHIIQMINGPSGAYFTVYNKNGTVALPQGYMDAITGISSAGDPIALYDQLADRYFISEFGKMPANKLIVMVSQTNNPLGSWYVYSFDTPQFPDYPHYGLWNNAYICTTNEGDNAIYAMDRTKMLVGDLTATMQRFSIPGSTTIGFQAAAPVCVEGTTPPPAGTPAMIMRMVDDAWTTAADVDRLEMWNLSVDFATPVNSVLSQQADLNTAPFDTDLCGYTTLDCIAQQGSAVKLDPIREILMNKIIYRNFGTHQSIVCNHSVDVTGADRAGIRWYEVRKTGAAPWGIYQQGTYSPDANNRWMGSICIDVNGAIGLAYNVSSTTVFPSIRYTSRKPCDPLGIMTQPETAIVAGASSQDVNRWGDYNSLCIDPADNRTMWFTGMYMPAVGGWSTRIAAFDISTCVAEVLFAGSGNTVNESAGTTPNNCKPYTDIITSIQIGQAPTAAATVTITATGTATIGSDYDLIYTNPITLDAAGLSKPITIRVYNDGIVETPETVILNYTLNANGGNAIVGSTFQNYTLTINSDDDFAPAPSDTLFTENFDAITTGLGTWTQTVLSGTSNRWIVNNAATGFVNKAAYVSNNTTTFANTYTVTQTSSIRLESATINTVGKSNMLLKFKYKCAGEIASGVVYDYGQVVYSADGGTSWNVLQTNMQGVTTATNQTIVLPAAAENIANLKIGFQFICDNSAGTQPPMGVDSVYIYRTGQNIQTAVNTTTGFDEEYLGPNATIHYYDRGTGNIIATVTNLSAHDYGCTKIEVDRAGTSAVNLANTNAANRLFSKTYKITPTTNNASGNIKVKLFYTNAEVLGWQGVTGQATNVCYMFKVSGNNNINSVNPSNFSSFVITRLPATAATFGSNTSFEATFSNGFSGFGIGVLNSGILPVNFISFSGKFLNKNQIQLDWATASELGTKNYEVQRSNDGISFEKIATVLAAGNANSRRDYAQLDNNFKRNAKNYYRLKMNDENGQFRYSEIVILEDKNTEQIEIFPNPVQDGIVNIRLADNFINQKIIMTLYANDGKRLMSKILIQNITLQQINIAKLADGTYTIQLSDGKNKLYQQVFVVAK